MTTVWKNNKCRVVEVQGSVLADLSAEFDIKGTRVQLIWDDTHKKWIQSSN